VKLPGTLDENSKGNINTNHNETMRLSRERTFEGMAWYQKKITIEKQWEGKEIFLTLERTKPSKVWIDNNFAGESSTILTPQKFNLTRFLTPGEHTITILVNNGKGSVPDGIKGSHAWTEHTQTNWNGIIGEISLEAVPKTHIQSIHVNYFRGLKNFV
jgi:beta-galactosidase/beta-glucuronidase